MNIEDTLMNATCVPDIPLDIELMDKQYGNESGVPVPPLEGVIVFSLKEELAYLYQQWRNEKGNEEPECFGNMLHMVNVSLKKLLILIIGKSMLSMY